MNRTLPKAALTGRRLPWGAYLAQNFDLYVMLLPALAFIIIFAYVPMYGVLMAFQDYVPVKGILGSTWVGFKHFIRFFTTRSAVKIIPNTIILSLYSILASFPFPIILALMLHYAVNKRMAKLIQTITYIPHFISIIVIVGMMNLFFSPNYGVVNFVLQTLGHEVVTFMSGEKYFRHMYVWSGIWQGMGFGAIIYFSALAGVDPTLYEVAMLDGAGKLARIWNIDLPTIKPTCIIMLILAMGGVISVGFDKTFAMQNARNAGVSEVISTFVYKVGLIDNRYSFSVAVGLFTSVINFTMLGIVNAVSKRVSQTALW